MSNMSTCICVKIPADSNVKCGLCLLKYPLRCNMLPPEISYSTGALNFRNFLAPHRYLSKATSIMECGSHGGDCSLLYFTSFDLLKDYIETVKWFKIKLNHCSYLG